MRMLRSLLLAGVAAAALSACAQDQPLHYVGTPLLLPDGHSSEGLLAGGVCADPKCWTQDTVTGGVHTYYRGGVLVSDVHDLRPVTAPAAGYAFAQMAVPAAVNAAGSVGAGALVAHSVQMAGAYQAEGTYKGDIAIGHGLASAKPPVVNVANGNSISTSVNNSLSAVSSSRSSASATARAQQSQMQMQTQRQGIAVRLDPPNDQP